MTILPRTTRLVLNRLFDQRQYHPGHRILCPVRLSNEYRSNTVSANAWSYRGKTEALAFLHDTYAKPDQYAHVVIQHGAWELPVVRDYLVGPLPISKSTQMTQLREQYHEPDVPYHARGIYTTADGRSVGQFLKRVMTPLKHITRDLFGAEANGNPDDTIVASGSAPLSYDGTWRRMWVRCSALRFKTDSSFHAD